MSLHTAVLNFIPICTLSLHLVMRPFWVKLLMKNLYTDVLVPYILFQEVCPMRIWSRYLLRRNILWDILQPEPDEPKLAETKQALENLRRRRLKLSEPVKQATPELKFPEITGEPKRRSKLQYSSIPFKLYLLIAFFIALHLLNTSTSLLPRWDKSQLHEDRSTAFDRSRILEFWGAFLLFRFHGAWLAMNLIYSHMRETLKTKKCSQDNRVA